MICCKSNTLEQGPFTTVATNSEICLEILQNTEFQLWDRTWVVEMHMNTKSFLFKTFVKSILQTFHQSMLQLSQGAS